MIMIQLFLALLLIFVACMMLILAFTPFVQEERPTLKMHDLMSDIDVPLDRPKPKKNPLVSLKILALINKPLVSPEMRRSLSKSLSITQSNMSPEEFLLVKEITIGALLLLVPGLFGPDMMLYAILMSIAIGYYLPEFKLRSNVQKVKDQIVKMLPDTVDLLGLCVNAGLDFMMALKWVVEKSAPNAVVTEMNNLLQEINVGKPRREALRDLARKYELPDLSTFSRTLIQADKMGTSVSEALNILSEDMRLARYRRGEALALKAPMKMLVPLLLCIFPVVGILVGGPIFLDFLLNNPMKNMGGG
ncbi:MAG: type II secretion system F family protein [Candidatus Omnitrophica bacterium]|nr:type II secretion system F family protein [Candidatus Omnitrophota bacterium]